MRQALLRAYRRLPESVRYGLRPVNAVEEAASFLPSGPRLALLELVRAYRSATAAAHHRGELALLEGVSRVDGAVLRVASDLAGDAAAYWSGLLFEGVPGRQVVGVRGPLGFARVALPDADLTLLRLNRLVRRRARARGHLATTSSAPLVHGPLEQVLHAQKHPHLGHFLAIARAGAERDRALGRERLAEGHTATTDVAA